MFRRFLAGPSHDPQTTLLPKQLRIINPEQPGTQKTTLNREQPQTTRALSRKTPDNPSVFSDTRPCCFVPKPRRLTFFEVNTPPLLTFSKVKSLTLMSAHGPKIGKEGREAKEGVTPNRCQENFVGVRHVVGCLFQLADTSVTRTGSGPS